MKSAVYTQLKTMVNSFTLPGAVFSVVKNSDGSCSDLPMTINQRKRIVYEISCLHSVKNNG
jgi:hypothetical protein